MVGFSRENALVLAMAGFTLMAGACASTSQPVVAGPAYAIYTARIVDQKDAGAPPCPPEHICMSRYNDITLQPLETIAGNPNPGRQTFRRLMHGQFRSDLILVAHTRRDEGRAWKLVDLALLSMSACFEAEDDILPHDDIVTHLDEAESRWGADKTADGEVCLSALATQDR